MSFVRYINTDFHHYFHEISCLVIAHGNYYLFFVCFISFVFKIINIPVSLCIVLHGIHCCFEKIYIFWGNVSLDWGTSQVPEATGS